MLLTTIASFQVIGTKSYIKKTIDVNKFGWVRHGSLSDHDGVRDIQDVDLKQFIYSNLGSNYQSLILAFTQCFCGNFIDDFQFYPRTTILSANPPDCLTFYGGYHKGLSINLKPGITTQDAHDAACAPAYDHPWETPQHVGSSTLIGGTDDTYILVWASIPDGTSIGSDWDDLNNIVSNFPDADITAYYGNGTGVNVDGAATWDNMRNYFVNLGSIIDTNDQFILFVTDHGDLDPVMHPETIEDTWENVLFIEPSLLALIEEDLEYIPYLQIYTTSQYAENYLEWGANINGETLGGYERYECDYNGNQIIDENERIEYIFEINIEYLEEGNNNVKIFSYNGFPIYNVSIGIGTGLIRKRQSPDSPTIDGPNSGKPGINYEYTFVSTSPDKYDLSYYIEWGDGTITNWTEFQSSGESYTESHAWVSKGDYIVKTKVKDIYGIESDWGYLEVSIPRTISFNSLLMKILERFPNTFPILRHLMGL